MNIRLKKHSFYVLIISLFLLCITSLPVKAANKNVVRVGFPLMDGLSMKDGNGNYYGYNYDYLMQIAQYTGWELEFVEAEGDVNQRITTLMEMLKNGEIDLMGDTKYMEALTGDYDYASEPYGSAYNVVAVRNDSDLYDLNSLVSKKDLKIGVLKTASKRAVLLEQFAQSNGFTYEEIICENEQDISDKIENKEIDAFLHVDISLPDNCHSIARFSPDPFFFITTKGNSQLMSELNKALITINQINPTFSSSLYNRYFSVNTTDIQLNASEKNYLKTHSELNVLVCDGFAPVQYYDKKTKGIATDVLSKLSEDTDVTFRYIKAKDFNEYKELANNSDIDIVLGLPYQIQIANEMNIILSDPYLSSSVTLVTSKGTAPSALTGLMQAVTPYNSDASRDSKNTTTYDTPEAALKAVNSGKAQYTYVSSYMYTYYMNKYGFTNLSSIESSDYTKTQYAFGIIKSDDLTLLSILNKVIRAQGNDINNYIYKNAYVEKQFVLSTFVSNNLAGVLICIGLAALIILYFVHSHYKKQLQMKKAVEIEYKRFQMLADISGEMTFSYDYLRKYLKVSNRGLHTISDEEIIKDFTKIDITQSQYPEILKHIYNYLLDKKDVQCECETKLLGGNKRWYQISIKIIRDDSNKTTANAIYAVGKVVDIQKEKLEKEELRLKSETDILTGLLNRGAAEKAITASLLNDSGNNALMILDLDNFKRINDDYGHIEGDKVLVETAHVLSDIYNSNIVSRLGGDEFIVYMSNITDKQLEEICGKTLNAFQHLQVMKDKSFALSISMGVVRTSHDRNFIELLKQADSNLYEVKRNGRNNYIIS